MGVEPEIPQYTVGETVYEDIDFENDSGAPYNPATVLFSYRKPDGSVVSVTPTSSVTGHWTAQWDVDAAGRWVFEWLTSGPSIRQGGEFDVKGSLIASPIHGLVGRSVASIIPLTWDNLKNSPIYGEAQLSRRIEATKHRLLGVTMAESDESGWSVLLVDYISKCCALDLIPTAIEFWMRQKITITTTGTSETTSFSDPIPALRDLQKRLTVEVAQLAGSPDIVALSTQRGEAPGLSGNDDDTFVTENPFDFPVNFRNLA